MPDILTVSHLTKSFGKLYAVNRLSFEVKKGEILGIMGPMVLERRPSSIFSPDP